MKAIQITGPGAPFELIERDIPAPGPGQVLIKVQACGVCHGEAILKGGHFPGVSYPRVPGHEVIGTITELGTGVSSWQVGQRVGVGWHGGHCFQCAACRRGDFGDCDLNLITGITIDGGYAEYVVSRSEAPIEIPAELDSYEGAPLLCAGRTVFGALKDSGARGGDLVAVHGIGGLGHLAIQYARKLGFKTVAISRGTDKQELSLKLGAHVFIDENSGGAGKELAALGGARVIICTAPNSKAIVSLIEGLGRGGKIVMVSAPPDMMQFHPGSLLHGGRSIMGYVSGDLRETIHFSLLSDSMPMIETFSLAEAPAAFEKMMAAKVHFRAVLKVS